jgi:pyruvate dehydrogenase (quinone)
MSKTVSDFIVSRLQEWGVKRVFGYPGDGINGVMGALNRAKDSIDFIQVRHEETAAFMACGHAKFTGEVGVCIATSGPGAIHLLNGLYDAKLDHQPVLAIVGQQARMALGGSFQQEVDLVSLFKDVASNFVQMCSDPRQIRHLVDRAMRIALTERTVTCIILPNDIQELSYEEPPRQHGSIHTSVGYYQPHIIPDTAQLRTAAEILNTGEKVAILIGAGAIGAAEELIEIAELLGAGVAKALLGKMVLPDDLPFVTGAIGLLGTETSWNMMTECDTLLMIGSGFPYSEFLPKEGQAKGVQIDIDGKMLGLRYPMDVHLQGDAKITLRALIPLINRKDDRSWRENIEKWNNHWGKVLEARAQNTANPINPQTVFWQLDKLLPANSIITADSGSTAFWYARDIKARKGMMGSLSGTLATMCPGIGYSLAAKFAYPDRPAIALMGDGAMQMQGINGLITVAKYWKEWTNPQFIVIVLNNRDLNMVTWEQRVMEGAPKFEDSQELPDFHFAAYAQLLDFEGIRISNPDEIESALQKGIAAKKPVLLEFMTDPNVAPLPPHISMKQAKDFMVSMVKGEKGAWETIKQTMKDVKENYFPG